MSFRLVQELAAGEVLVAVACRVLGVSTSGYYEWRGRPPSRRALADAALSVQIREIHVRSRGTYGVPRVHAELRLGRGLRCGRKRVARLMRAERLHGIYRRRGKHARPAAAVHDDLVQRRFQADAPNRLWLTDITEHPTHARARSTAQLCSTSIPAASSAGRSPTTCGAASPSTPL